jgi:quercetin dioxygenase-like cupin family protein
MDEQNRDGPEILEMGKGVRIIDDVLAAYGIDTLEGRVGPLLFGKTGRSHFLDMPASSYVAEHPHADEAFTFTFRGSYVLCVDGERHLMKPGSFQWFGPDVPTGYEVPFDEPAYILVFRGVVGETPAEMLESIERMKDEFVEKQEAGDELFMLRDLPEDHPARIYAHKVNPASF